MRNQPSARHALDMRDGGKPVIYQLRVRGILGERFLQAFPGFTTETQDGATILTGSLPDQAALFGAIARIEALGLELVDIRRTWLDRPPE